MNLTKLCRVSSKITVRDLILFQLLIEKPRSVKQVQALFKKRFREEILTYAGFTEFIHKHYREGRVVRERDNQIFYYSLSKEVDKAFSNT